MPCQLSSLLPNACLQAYRRFKTAQPTVSHQTTAKRAPSAAAAEHRGADNKHVTPHMLRKGAVPPLGVYNGMQHAGHLIHPHFTHFAHLYMGTKCLLRCPNMDDHSRHPCAGASFSMSPKDSQPSPARQLATRPCGCIPCTAPCAHVKAQRGLPGSRKPHDMPRKAAPGSSQRQSTEALLGASR